MGNFFHLKSVAITGGSSGIGRALALRLLSEGARVSVCGRDFHKLEMFKIDACHPLLLIVKADVTVEEDCRHFIEETVITFGTLDILINNAGISMRAMFRFIDLQVLERCMDTNFWGTVYCTRYALQHVIENKGTIAGISSIAGFKGLPARTGYSASKFAMQGFLEALRIELLPQKVNVMWICPGFVRSNIRNTALNSRGESQKETPLDENTLMSPEKCARKIMNAIARGQRTRVMTLQGKLTVWLNKFFPSLMDWVVYRHFAAEPDSPLKKTQKPTR